jgi:hypothetical protein
MFALFAGTAGITIGAATLALALDGAPAGAGGTTRERAAASAPIAEPGCGRACTSYVIAAPVPGGSAHVVSGVSAFGLALDPGAAVAAPERSSPRAVPAPVPGVQASAVAGVSIGASGAFSASAADVQRVWGGTAFALATPAEVTIQVE